MPEEKKDQLKQELVDLFKLKEGYEVVSSSFDKAKEMGQDIYIDLVTQHILSKVDLDDLELWVKTKKVENDIVQNLTLGVKDYTDWLTSDKEVLQ